jgi:haloacetate dehalogenase
LPEKLLAAAPDAVLDWEFEVMHAADDAVIEPAARAVYRAAFHDPAVRHAMCEDYRAALDEDFDCDRADRAAGRKLDCPVLALWSEHEVTGPPLPIDVWKKWADNVVGGVTTGDHLQAEDRPTEVLAALVPFLRLHAA